ncbi:MAG: DNA repair protein RadA [Candidatus Babeliales bacterium]
MAKQTVTFNCATCGYRPPKWLGCCPECNTWGSIAELKQTTVGKTTFTTATRSSSLTPLTHVSVKEQERMYCGIDEWDRVLGGGIVRGSFLILTGDPGIGKSTLLLQITHRLAQRYRVFYFSSEESLPQIRSRAERLGCLHDNLLCSDEAELDSIIATATQEKPDIIIIDSIQNCYHAQSQVLPGSIGQLREAGFALMRLAKEHNIATLLTGHITKEGTIAGPKMLEHMVDGVFYLQGEDRWQTRMLRSVKNRFGSLGELGFFQMEANGMQEMPDINKHMVSEASHSPGAVLMSSLEGSRPVLLEVQALLVPTKFGMPQRVISGADQKQVLLIAAILEKYLHIKLSAHDLFLKVSGGFRIKDNSADLAIALALLSSYFQQAIPAQSIALAEISLTGHIKPINQITTHIKEAQKFGFHHLLTAYNQKIDDTTLKIMRFSSVYDLMHLFQEA